VSLLALLRPLRNEWLMTRWCRHTEHPAMLPPRCSWLLTVLDFTLLAESAVLLLSDGSFGAVASVGKSCSPLTHQASAEAGAGAKEGLKRGSGAAEGRAGAGIEELCCDAGVIPPNDGCVDGEPCTVLTQVCVRA
jgi:hypothetical protein